VSLQNHPDGHLIEACWRAGDLSYLFHDGQLGLSGEFHRSDGRLYVVCCSRRYGKSYWLCVEAIQECLRTPRGHVRYAAPTRAMCRSIVEPHIHAILGDCPSDLKPKYRRHEGMWVFPNGAQLTIAGCDLGGAERLRGVSTHLALIDEAGFIDDLDYLYKDVLLPQLITTEGRVLMASTPARSPVHAFTKYCLDAQLRGTYQHRTIYDAPHIPNETADEFIREAGGPKSSAARREYFGEVVVDKDLAIIPEFVDMEHRIVRETELPDHFDPMTTGDFGFNDLTAVVFSFWDFAQAKLTIWDELEFVRSNTGVIAPAVLEKEIELFGRPAYNRVADAPLQQLADLAEIHACPFAPTRKDDADAALNALRVDIASEKIVIHPRCKRTRAHLRHGIWRQNRKDYARSGEFGHFDFIDAVKYAARSTDRHRNPDPGNDPRLLAQTHFVRRGGQVLRNNDDAVRQIFGGLRVWGR